VSLNILDSWCISVQTWSSFVGDTGEAVGTIFWNWWCQTNCRSSCSSSARQPAGGLLLHLLQV